MRSRVSLCVVVGLLASCLPSQGGRLQFEAFGAGLFRAGGFGADLAASRDISGDGIPDIAVASRADQEIRWLSGADGSLIRAFPVSGADAVAVLEDVDGDGAPDVATLGRFSFNVYSGATGAQLLNGGIVVGFTPVVVGLTDWSFDGIPDFVVSNTGVLEIRSGADGAVVSTVGSSVGSAAAFRSRSDLYLAWVANGTVTATAVGSTMWSVSGGYDHVASAGDPNADGFDDVVATAGGRADLLSGVDGTLIRSISIPSASAVAGGVDLNGDRVPDVAVSDGGVMRAYSGADGSLLIERSDGFGTGLAMVSRGTGARSVVLAGQPVRFGPTVRTGAVLALAEAAPGELDGSFRPFGNACNFTTLERGPGVPAIGRRYGFRFDSNTGGGFEFIVIGGSNSVFQGVTLPVRPTSSPCQLLVSVDIVQASSGANAGVSIPNNPLFVGTEVFVQGVSLLSGRFETSNAAAMFIGN